MPLYSAEVAHLGRATIANIAPLTTTMQIPFTLLAFFHPVIVDFPAVSEFTME
jgi:hypothetical protein